MEVSKMKSAQGQDRNHQAMQYMFMFTYLTHWGAKQHWINLTLSINE